MTVSQGATGNAATWTYTGLLTALFTLPPQYRAGASLLVSDSEMRALMLMVDSQQRPLWQPNIAAGAPPTFLGYPVYVHPDLAAAGASAKSIVFADFKRLYWIRRVAGFQMQRQNELHSDSGQVGFRGYERVDGRVVIADAGRILQHSAT